MFKDVGLKSIISILLLICVSISLCGCFSTGPSSTRSSYSSSSSTGSNYSSSQSNKIALTKDNINNYLEINATSYGSDSKTTSSYDTYYQSVVSSVSISSTNSSFVFENCMVSIEIYGSIFAGIYNNYDQSRNYTYTTILSCKLNAGGGGSAKTVDYPSDITNNPRYKCWKVNTKTYSVVSVSGYVITK